MAVEEKKGVDLSGLSEEARSELGQLVNAEDSPDEGESAEGTEEQDPVGDQAETPKRQRVQKPPAWAREMMGQMETLQASNRALEASNRTLQGQVRSYESRPKAEPKPPPDPFEGLDTDDPAVRALVAKTRQLEARIEDLSGAAHETKISAEEQQERANWFAYLEQNAGILGVSWETVEAKVRRLPTLSIATEGMALIAAAQKAGNGQGGDEGASANGTSGTSDFDKGKQAGIETLAKKLGIYEEIRATAPGKTGTRLTMDQINKMSPQEFADRGISDEELATILDR